VLGVELPVDVLVKWVVFFGEDRFCEVLVLSFNELKEYVGLEILGYSIERLAGN
jgi:hypothetical protein